MYEDVYSMTADETVFYIEKNIAELVFSGAKLDDMPITLPETRQILEDLSVAGVKPSDIASVLNLKNAFQYVEKDVGHFEFNDILKIHELIVANEPAKLPGSFRSKNVHVNLEEEEYVPGIPDPNHEQDFVQEILSSGKSTTAKALDMMLRISRQQYFMDGNKRTAMVVATKILATSGAGVLVIKPSQRHWYGSQLMKYDKNGNDQGIKDWLYEHAIQGM